MSLITRCPACGTMFKVVPDQLRISEGWVRCGHCAEVFDASAHMQGATDIAVPAPVGPAYIAPEPAAPEPAPPEPAPPESQDIASTFTDSQVERNLYNLLLEDPGVETPAGEVPAPAPLRKPVRSSRPSPLDVLDDDAGDVPSSLDDAALDDISFVRQARRKAFWRRPLVRATLWLAALALLAVLALQAVVHERDRIAAMEPRTRPWLVQLCAPLQCTVGPLRQIESIVIDSSSFAKLRPDAYRLTFTIKNNATVSLAVPAIELSLTDAADQPVVRRVLLAADLRAASPGLSPALAPGGEWTGTFPLTVSGSGLRIAGYRLLAFYP